MSTIKLDKEFAAKVRAPIISVWNYIASDAYEMASECGERMTNKGALELVIDADRLSRSNPEAGKLIDEAFDQHSWTKVISCLSKNIKLV